MRSLLRLFSATNTILSVLPVCTLHVLVKLAITHANNWFLTLAFYIIFTWATANFMWAQARVCPGVATYTTDLYSSVPLYILAACIPFLQHSVHPRFNVLLYALRTKLRTWTCYFWNVDRLQFVMVGIFNSCFLILLFPHIHLKVCYI